jgi:hypothetical protein
MRACAGSYKSGRTAGISRDVPGVPDTPKTVVAIDQHLRRPSYAAVPLRAQIPVGIKPVQMLSLGSATVAPLG